LQESLNEQQSNSKAKKTIKMAPPFAAENEEEEED
jgi:hypothetical protein